MSRSTTHAVLALYSWTCALEPISSGRLCVVAIACYVCSSGLARKSTLIANKPFLAMFINCACASFVDELQKVFLVRC